jgi:hypothetical protein
MTARFWDDVTSGTPLSGVAGHHAPYWCWREDTFKDGLELLARARVGQFGRIQADPAMREESISLASIVGHHARLESGGWHGAGPQAEIRVPFVVPRRIYGIRFVYTLEAATDPAPMRVSWLRPTDDPREAVGVRDLGIKLRTGPTVKTQTVWIHETVKEIGISPSSEEFRFDLRELTLLVPAE